ncbi:unnamed protein product [Caenorhabditis nigoni]|uniref:Uncharacterized protein n=2 Tax=Caenorhabditis nigoni TaxID=1611254 RepID=A0A2G5VDW3_9PELO|nr:hypothetical protein B9Z55_000104 [Caenorhabditis nigoni]
MSAMDNNETTEMKVGHPPATMVGGRRIVNRKERKASDSNEHTNSESSDEVVREILDADLPAKMDRSYPTEAVKRVHEKPQPAIQPNHVFRADKSGQHQFQPRKQTH